MPATPFDAEALRADLGAKLDAAGELAEKLDAEIGVLALAVVLGESPESDLAGAREARANAAAKVAELRAALVAVDAREAAQDVAAAAAMRESDLAERERLVAVVAAASTQAVALVGKLATCAGEALEAEAKAVRIAKKHDVQPRSSQSGQAAYDLAVVMGAKLHALGIGVPYQQAAKGDEAERRLRAVV